MSLIFFNYLCAYFASFLKYLSYAAVIIGIITYVLFIKMLIQYNKDD